MPFVANHEPLKKKGMTDYRASLTRESYEQDPAKCLRIVKNILDRAEQGDPTCLKIFAQCYMTKAPAEMQMTIQNNAGISKNTAKKMIDYLVSTGLSKAEASKKIMEVGLLLDIAQEDDDV